VATMVEESGAPPLPMTAVVVEEGQTVTETTAPQATLEPSVGSGPGGTDVVMVPTDDDSSPPPPAGDHEVAASTVPEPSPVAGATSVEDAVDLAACRHVDFPGIGTIDLDATELPSKCSSSHRSWTPSRQSRRRCANMRVLAAQRSLPHRRRQWSFSRSPRSARSRSWSCPCHRRPERAWARPCPSPLKQSQPHPLLRWSTWRRVLLERRGLHHPGRLLLPRRRSSYRASPPQPLRNARPPRARQGPPPQDPGGRRGHERSFVRRRHER
jgi:hypothetical protein